MKDQKESKKLNRFTTLHELLDLLRRSKVVLRDPQEWEDKNDTELIQKYRNIPPIQKVFAKCFCTISETIHHWKTYASGSLGCCIEFDREELLKSLKEQGCIEFQPSFKGKEGFFYGDVQYKKLKDVEGLKEDPTPFVKRKPYRFEYEFRIIWQGPIESNAKKKEIEVNLNSIRKITLSQELPEDVFKLIKEFLNQKCGIPLCKINQSTLYRNPDWINAFDC